MGDIRLNVGSRCSDGPKVVEVGLDSGRVDSGRRSRYSSIGDAACEDVEAFL